MHDTNHIAFERPLLDQACSAIRSGQFEEAIALLNSARSDASRDGFAWNLLGVAHECRKEWDQAKRCYGKAMLADPRLRAAQQNMQRMYELHTFGKTLEPLSLGEHEILLRKSLENSLTRSALVSTPF
jgi:tetratricopeptide (TPR) repeat protein